MDDIFQLHNTILEQQNSQLWSGYTNMLKILKEIFVSPKHWVLEFLQNSEDANSEELAIIFDKNSLSIYNDGKVFSKRDFQAICTVESQKLGIFTVEKSEKIVQNIYDKHYYIRRGSTNRIMKPEEIEAYHKRR